MRDLIRDIPSFLLGASMVGFPIGYAVGGYLSKKFYKKR